MAKRNPGLRNRGFATEHRSVDGEMWTYRFVKTASLMLQSLHS